MRKGFLASVAALAASAGVAFGQGGPEAAGWPTWPGAGAPPTYMPVSMSGQAPPMDPGAMPPVSGLPPATELPRNGPVYPPSGMGPGFTPPSPVDDGGGDPALPPGAMSKPKQVHQVAGGPDRCWFELDYLICAIRTEPIAAPLVTAGPKAGSGLLGTEGTHVVVGDKNLDFGTDNGLRLSVGVWDADHKYALEVSAFLMEQKAFDNTYTNDINQRTLLARPVFDATTPVNGLPGNPTAVIVADPGVNTGSVRVYANDRIGGTEANIWYSCMNYDRIKLNPIVGFRFLDLDEKLEVYSQTNYPPVANPTVNTPALLEIADSFTCHNLFYGANVGLQTELRSGRWFCDAYAKVAVGTVHEIISANGETRFTPQFGGVPSINPSGLLVLEPNTGHNDRWEFAYVPEINLKFGYQMTQRISAYLGYDFLYISSVVRPGDQVDSTINSTLLPVSTNYNPGAPFGVARPQTLFKTGDYWVQGFQMGVSIRY